MRTFAVGLVCLVAFVSLLACERIQRVRQCRGLVVEVNDTMRTIRAAGEDGLTSDELEASARDYGDLADALGPMEFNDRQMAVDVETFRRLLRRAAELSEEVARTNKANERAQAALLVRELEALEAPMQASAHKLNGWCQERD